jgi:L-2-hydroxyglutarate oxidase LhgO
MEDVIIIGAGAVGSFIARSLSRYALSVLVLEKENDVGDVTTMANSAISHSGYDPDSRHQESDFQRRWQQDDARSLQGTRYPVWESRNLDGRH